MKKLLVFCLLLLVFSCNKEEKTELSLLNKDELESSELSQPQGGEFHLQIYSSSEWTAEKAPDCDWIILNEKNGHSGNSELVISTTVNNTKQDRSSEIRIETAYENQILLIEQSGTSVIEKLSVKSVSLSSASQNTETILTTGYGMPDIDIPSEWVKIDQIEKLSNIKYRIEFSVEANEEPDDRSQNIAVISGNGKKYSFSILQSANKLELLENELLLGCGESVFSIYVKTNVDIQLDNLPSWLSVKDVVDAGDVSIVLLKTEANTSSEIREAKVLVSSENFEPLECTVIQEGNVGNRLDWCSEDFIRKNVIFKFTGTWCGFCPKMSQNLDIIEKERPEKFSVISIYNKSENEVNYTSENIANYYGVGAVYPVGVIDGRVRFYNDKEEPFKTLIYDVADETDYLYPVNCTFDVKTETDGNNIKIDLKIYCKKPGSYKLALAILEDNVKAYQNGVSGGEYIHNNVLRKYITDELGDELSFEESEIRKLQYEMAFPGNVLNNTNCKIVAYIYSETPFIYSDVKDASIVENYTYIDNAVEVRIGEQYIHKYK